MAAEKTLAIVVRLVDFSETSSVVTLFTQDFGKLGALAKGAKRPKGPFDSALDLLALCRIVFIHKSPDVLDLLTEAKLERRFRAASRDLTRLYAGYYVAELLRELTDYGDPHPGLFRAADRALGRLDTEAPVPEVVFRFEALALRELGYLPTLDTCVLCGQPLEREGPVLFGLQAGGVLCGACRVGQRQVVRLSPRVLSAIGQLAAADGEQGAVPLDHRVRGELRGLFNHFVASLLGHPPRMHRYLGFSSG
jgi:DNA repair protein RecO (recombination protein O)